MNIRRLAYIHGTRAVIIGLGAWGIATADTNLGIGITAGLCLVAMAVLDRTHHR